MKFSGRIKLFKRVAPVVCGVFVTSLILCGYIPPQDRQYLDYFLKLYSADLFRNKNFVLIELGSFVRKDEIERIEMVLSYYRPIARNDARQLIVDMIDDILKAINEDPSLHARGLLSRPFTSDRLIFEIHTDNLWSANADVETCERIRLERNMITYYRYPWSTILSAGVDSFSEEYLYARMLCGKPTEFVPYKKPNINSALVPFEGLYTAEVAATVRNPEFKPFEAKKPACRPPYYAFVSSIDALDIAPELSSESIGEIDWVELAPEVIQIEISTVLPPKVAFPSKTVKEDFIQEAGDAINRIFPVPEQKNPAKTLDSHALQTKTQQAKAHDVWKQGFNQSTTSTGPKKGSPSIFQDIIQDESSNQLIKQGASHKSQAIREDLSKKSEDTLEPSENAFSKQYAPKSVSWNAESLLDGNNSVAFKPQAQSYRPSTCPIVSECSPMGPASYQKVAQDISEQPHDALFAQNARPSTCSVASDGTPSGPASYQKVTQDISGTSPDVFVAKNATSSRSSGNFDSSLNQTNQQTRPPIGKGHTNLCYQQLPVGGASPQAFRSVLESGENESFNAQTVPNKSALHYVSQIDSAVLPSNTPEEEPQEIVPSEKIDDTDMTSNPRPGYGARLWSWFTGDSKLAPETNVQLLVCEVEPEEVPIDTPLLPSDALEEVPTGMMQLDPEDESELPPSIPAGSSVDMHEENSLKTMPFHPVDEKVSFVDAAAQISADVQMEEEYPSTELLQDANSTGFDVDDAVHTSTATVSETETMSQNKFGFGSKLWSWLKGDTEPLKDESTVQEEQKIEDQLISDESLKISENAKIQSSYAPETQANTPSVTEPEDVQDDSRVF